MKNVLELSGKIGTFSCLLLGCIHGFIYLWHKDMQSGIMAILLLQIAKAWD